MANSKADPTQEEQSQPSTGGENRRKAKVKIKLTIKPTVQTAKTGLNTPTKPSQSNYPGTQTPGARPDSSGYSTPTRPGGKTPNIPAEDSPEQDQAEPETPD